MVDIPGNSSTTTSLTVGSSISDVLEVNGDHDWISIDLVAGQTYSFSLNGSGVSPLADPLLVLRDSTGAIIASNDDGGPGANSRMFFTAATSGSFFIDVGAFGDGYSGGYTLSVQNAVYTQPQIANFLTDGYWEETGRARHAFGTTTITYNIQNLTAEGQALAVAAFDVWAAATGLNFVVTAAAAQITFDDNQSGAFANYTASGGTTTSSTVNVSTNWLASYGTDINSYSFQTYIHEIGHSLGLGHAGNYNGSAGWRADGTGDNHFLNDSWQATIMSYFDQDDNAFVNASRAFVIGPMMADIIAIQDLYGVPSSVNTGATTYGFNNTASGFFDFSLFLEGSMVAFTIFDSSGVDTLDASGFVGPQRIDLRAGYFSDIGGEVGNIGIATNAQIENAVGGSGNDVIVGNDAENNLYGNGGNDDLDGGVGADYLSGGQGNDIYRIDNVDEYLVEATGNGYDRVLSSVSYTLGFGVSVELVQTTNQTGSAAIDFTGNALNQRLEGNNGINVLNGGDGADILVGFSGNDTYYVSSIDQIIEVAGGGTLDRALAAASFNLAVDDDIEYLSTTNQAGTSSINLVGNGVNQTVVGNAGVNVLNGNGGSDILRGFGGNDIYYVDGNDTIDEGVGQGTLDRALASTTFALAADDNIEYLATTSEAGATAINLLGNSIAQTIVGNAAANTLVGYGGADTLRGLGGSDIFSFRNVSDSGVAAGTRDIIADFDDIDGTAGDRIDLALIDAVTGGADNAFSFIAGAAFTAAGQIRVFTSGGNTIIEGNVGGSLAADFSIQLTGIKTLSSADFML